MCMYYGLLPVCMYREFLQYTFNRHSYLILLDWYSLYYAILHYLQGCSEAKSFTLTFSSQFRELKILKHSFTNTTYILPQYYYY